MTRKLVITTLLYAALMSGCAATPSGNVGLTSQGKNALGTAVGAGLGGYLGSKIGEGSSQTVATVSGTIIGGALGNALTTPAVTHDYYYTAPTQAYGQSAPQAAAPQP
jgi:outer membrane lipoprotein SlyB